LIRDRRKPHLQEMERNNQAVLDEMERVTVSGERSHEAPILEGLLSLEGRFGLLLKVCMLLITNWKRSRNRWCVSAELNDPIMGTSA
jgi:hypothetical protein